ncbi:ribosomal protein S5 domain 2-type protein [Lipomyces japonicus]|uniref:mitochondrial 37S ribosomal protein uS9m n=1 Tax=Lipomyces japonicus TaxID=56871 RepID=UPI0034CE530E
MKTGTGLLSNILVIGFLPNAAIGTRMAQLGRRTYSSTPARRQESLDEADKPVSQEEKFPRSINLQRTIANPGSQWRDDVSDKKYQEQVQEITRLAPVSPSYYSHNVFHNDTLLRIGEAIRKSANAPLASRTSPGQLISLNDYNAMNSTANISVKDYSELREAIKQLRKYDEKFLPSEALQVLGEFTGGIVGENIVDKKNPPTVDRLGRARAKGKRKDSRAFVWLARGEGNFLVNGRLLTDAFVKPVDREAAVRPLNVIGKLLDFNVFARVEGGGTTGQAGAISLALAKALRVHNRGLHPVLSKAGCLTQDRRVVERKKPGKPKARKSYQWVKR